MKKFIVLLCLCNILSLSGMIATYKGVQAFNKNDLQTAQKHFDTVLTDNPHHAQTLYNLGKIAYKQEQFDQAQAYFEKALQAPDISDQLAEQAQYDNGTSYVKLQEWQKALEQFEMVVKKNPNHEYAKKMIEQLKKKIEEEREKEQQQDQDKDDDQKDQQDGSQKQDQSNNKDQKDQSDSDTSHDKQNSEDSDNAEDTNEDSGTDEQKQESEEQKNKKNESSDKQNQSQNNDNKKDQQNNQQSSDNKQDKQQQTESKQMQHAQQQENGNQEEKKLEQGALDQASQQKNKEKIDVQTILLQEAERNDAYCVKQLLQQQLKNETVQRGTKNW